MKCCICGKEIEGHGNNPIPIRKKGRCCNECDSKLVTAYRIIELDVSEPKEKIFEYFLQNANKEQLEFGLEVIKTFDWQKLKRR